MCEEFNRIIKMFALDAPQCVRVANEITNLPDRLAICMPAAIASSDCDRFSKTYHSSVVLINCKRQDSISN